MNRREFVAGSLLGIAANTLVQPLAGALSSVNSGQSQSADDWRDPKFKAVQIAVPSFQGRLYEAEVPDTLDLTDRAKLSINAMTRLLDPHYDYTQFTFAEFRTTPPLLIEGHGGLICLNPKWAEALPLNRIMSGSTRNAEVDHHLLESFIHNTGKDGLAYQPPEHPGAFYDEYTRKQGKPYAEIFGEGRQLLTYSIWVQLTSDPLYHELAQRKIARLLDLAVPRQGALYFRLGHGYTPGQKNTDQIDIYAITDHEVMDPNLGMVGTAAAYSTGTVAMGASRYALVTGYEPALDLARGVANYFRQQGRLIDDSGKWYGWHFHIITTAILGTIEYGATAHDKDMLQWAQRAYEYGKSIGDPLVGFFAGVPRAEPSNFNPNARENGMDSGRMETEPCSIADMTLIALKLSRAGVADYYEDVEHYLRNLLVEEQITNLDFLRSFPREISASEQLKKTVSSLAPDPRQISTDKAAEKAVGSFVNSRPQQWYLGLPGPQACGCCLGNSSRVLYYAWDSILQPEGDTLRVNLLLNRASPWADLNSYLPYEGKVVLRMKQAKIPLVRIPSWADRQQVSCSVNGKQRWCVWEGSYIRIGAVQPGDKVVVAFPVVEKTLQRDIKSHSYTVTMRGFTIVDLQPHADVTPLFARAYYRHASAPLKNKTRFVSEQRIIW